jgi:hypothetical protein
MHKEHYKTSRPDLSTPAGSAPHSRYAKTTTEPTATQHKQTQRLRTIALGLIELCELGAAGLIPMRTERPTGESVNDLTRDQQHSHRPSEKDAFVEAESAVA